jgi:hypothetical protein
MIKKACKWARSYVSAYPKQNEVFYPYDWEKPNGTTTSTRITYNDTQNEVVARIVAAGAMFWLWKQGYQVAGIDPDCISYCGKAEEVVKRCLNI